MPAEAKGTSAKSAKVFARHYFDAINYASRTGDVSYLQSLGTAGCVSCSAIVGNIEEIYRDGGSIRSEGWKLMATRVLEAGHTHATLSLDVVLEPQMVVSSSGAAPQEHLGGKQPMTIFLDRQEGTWAVARLDLVA